jgi:urocanate hydratase
MSGAQPKAGNIAGCITVCAEVNAKITHIRHSQGWINEVIEDIDELVKSSIGKANKEIVSIAYLGNVVDVWEKFDETDIHRFGKRPDLLHNPYAGGYYPTDISFEDANAMMAENPILFKEKVQETLRHTTAINKHTAKEPISLIMEMPLLEAAQERI